MPLMKEAMSKEDYDRAEKGLAPLKLVKEARPDPEYPLIKSEIKLSDIPPDEPIKLEYANRNILKNKDGVSFIGFSVFILVLSDKIKEPFPMEGWMLEGEFLAFLRAYRSQINQNVIHW
jgi:hypothetical protein